MCPPAPHSTPCLVCASILLLGDLYPHRIRWSYTNHMGCKIQLGHSILYDTASLFRVLACDSQDPPNLHFLSLLEIVAALSV